MMNSSPMGTRNHHLTVSKPSDPSKEFTLEETVFAQMYEHEALLKLLIEKGVITQWERLK